jgi:hypothetical protein
MNFAKNQLNFQHREIYGDTWYMGLKYHLDEAYAEKNITSHYSTASPDIALFSESYYNQIQNIPLEKKYKYCWIGSINSNFYAHEWVIEFAKTNFDHQCIFINTDPDWTPIGEFDFSHKIKSYNPKIQYDNQSYSVQYKQINENIEYFTIMRQSQFCLCPCGDAPWSFRFYEILMCDSIPIVEHFKHTYRTISESQIGYYFFLKNDMHIYDENIIKYNSNLFKEYHLLKNNICDFTGIYNYTFLGNSDNNILILQGDGNLVIYDKNRAPLWDSGTWQPERNEKFILNMQNDGNLVIYNHYNQPIWSSNTCGIGIAPFKFHFDEQNAKMFIIDANHNITFSN